MVRMSWLWHFFTLSIYPSVHKQLIRTLFEAHVVPGFILLWWCRRWRSPEGILKIKLGLKYASWAQFMQILYYTTPINFKNIFLITIFSSTTTKNYKAIILIFPVNLVFIYKFCKKKIGSGGSDPNPPPLRVFSFSKIQLFFKAKKDLFIIIN